MEQYATTTQTFVIMSSVERDAMIATLTQALDYIEKHGEPATWNDHDRGILTRMIYLCGPVSHSSEHLPPFRLSIELDPTVSQIKKINKALAKIAIPALPLPNKKTPAIQSNTMARRMEDRRSKLMNWILLHQKDLRELAQADPRVIASLGATGDGTPRQADLELAARINQTLTQERVIDESGLFEF